MKRLFGLLCAITLAAPGAVAGSSPELTSVEPIVGLIDGQIRQCGVRARFSVGKAEPIELEITLERDSAQAELAVRVRGFAPGATVAMKPAQAAPKFQPAPAAGSVGLRAPANDPAATEFVRETFVSGMTAEVSDGGRRTALTINGPLPPSVRAAYLNCAGDLYRPGDQ